MKNKINGFQSFLLVFIPVLVVFIFRDYYLAAVSVEFIRSLLIIISISLIGLGQVYLKKEEFTLSNQEKQLKANILDATIWLFFSVLFGLTYLVYSKILFYGINFGMISVWTFLGGFLYFMLIIIKERLSIE